MTMIDLEESAKALLTRFFDEMNAWEKRAYASLKPDEPASLDRSVEELRCIYATYLTGKERKTGELAGPSVGASPRFDNDHEKIISVDSDIEKGKVVIVTEKTFPDTPDFKEINRYAVVKKRDGLKIDKREIYSPFRKKWMNIVF